MTEDYKHLSEKQLARVDALIAARFALSAKSVISSGAVDSVELIGVAEYIENGSDHATEGTPA